ncbi:MAG: hypothetical protein BIFFINMI_02617 [Phycisphaerae bacterium]|nr:hypothetical protein [Phycisphaerae bacterium]
MPQFRIASEMPVSPPTLYAWHTRPGAIDRLIPPWMRVRIVERGRLADGSRSTLAVRKLGLWRQWVAEHYDCDPPNGFRDRQVRGPWASWEHRHAFEPLPDGRSRMLDEIDYRLPLGPLGLLLAGGVRRDLARSFAYRHAQLRRDLLRHRRFADAGELRIAITGATGLIGRRLTPFLTTGGHEVLAVTRRPPPGSGAIAWDPAAGRIDAAALEGLDAVVHLAGENIAGRWTASRRRRILDSRTGGTRLLAEALAGLKRPPRVLVSASAIGYYGDRGDELLSEQSRPGEGFLPEVCVAWEKAADAARAAGIRVVHLRIGIVLAADGGALARMLPPFRAGMGGRLGGGRQYMSWIAIDDLIGAIHFAIMSDGLTGPANAVAPQAVTNWQFTRALGRVLRRPTVTPLPGFAIRVLLGQMGRDLLLASARVQPARLTAAGFEFQHPDLEQALRSELGRLTEGTT